MKEKQTSTRQLYQRFFIGVAASALLLVAGCNNLQKKMDQPSMMPGERANIHIPPNLDLHLQVVAEGLVSPLGALEAPDNSGRLFIIDQPGMIWIVDAEGNKLSQPFIDISSKLVTLSPFYDEKGLLGLAFHPDYAGNGKFYLFYTAPPPPGGPDTDAGNTGLPKVWNNTTTVSEWKVSPSNPNMADMSSEKMILQEAHPQGNHNGGTIAFGSDGYLYISIGDGGNKNDLGPGHVEDWYDVNAGGNGQDIEQNMMGSILRIDVNTAQNGKNYGIPADNPFVGKPGLDEIYAYGFRNPYRFSFDMSGSRRMFVGDAGQKLYEEISVLSKGGNYGWNVKEGPVCFNAEDEFTTLGDCPDVDSWGNQLIDPALNLENKAKPGGGRFVVVVAGEVYRGKTIPGLQGKYIFGNFSFEIGTPMGELYISNPNGPTPWTYQRMDFATFGNTLPAYVKGFGQDKKGEVYVTTSVSLGPSGNTGKVYKLVAM